MWNVRKNLSKVPVARLVSCSGHKIPLSHNFLHNLYAILPYYIFCAHKFSYAISIHCVFWFCLAEKSSYTIEEIQEGLCIMDSNSYHVLVRSAPNLQDFVSGLYIRAAMLNHSCRPNTRPVFHGNKDRSMSVLAIDDIQAGHEISTSYLEPFYTTLQRRSMLRRGKLFDCACRR